MPDPGADKGGKAGASGAGDSSNEATQLNFVTVAAAVASSLGVLGFVIFAGGAVLWQRFNEMGLPADDAVAFVPRGVLIATGADFLVPALLVAAATVLLPLLLPPLWRISSRPRHAVGRRLRTTLGKKRSDSAAPVASLSKGTARADRPAEAEGEGAAEAAYSDDDKRADDAKRVPWGAVSIGAMVFVVEFATALNARADAHLALGSFLLLVGLAAVGAFVVGLAQSLPAFGIPAVGLVTFLAVGVFWIARAFEESYSQLGVVPMAYSRAQPGKATRVEFGYLIAETSDRIVFASLPSPPDNELREFPRSQTTDLEIGGLTPVAEAKRQASRFAYNLCSRVNALTPATGTAANDQMPCSRDFLAQLARTAGLRH